MRICILTACATRSAGGLFFSVRELTKNITYHSASDVEIEVWTLEDNEFFEDFTDDLYEFKKKEIIKDLSDAISKKKFQYFGEVI